MREWPQREIARRVALVPQETYAPFDFTVLEIVLMGRFPHLGAFALEGPEDLAIAHRALAETGTAEFSERLFNTLSGGEKQRVVIASALAQSPQLLLLDEPTASLDVGHQIEVQTLLRRLNADSGVTMVLSTHDLNLAAALCRRLILIRNGQVIASGSTDNVLTKATVQVTSTPPSPSAGTSRPCPAASSPATSPPACCGPVGHRGIEVVRRHHLVHDARFERASSAVSRSPSSSSSVVFLRGTLR